MTTADAEYLVAKLFAAFPQHRDQTTAAVYVEAFQRLKDPDVALKAIDEAIMAERWLPPIALISETYDRVKPAPVVNELGWPALTDEQKADNIRRMKILCEQAAGDIDMETALARMNA